MGARHEQILDKMVCSQPFRRILGVQMYLRPSCLPRGGMDCEGLCHVQRCTIEVGGEEGVGVY